MEFLDISDEKIFLLLLILGSIGVIFYYSFWLRAISGIIKFPKTYKSTLSKKISDLVKLSLVTLFITLALTIIFYGILLFFDFGKQDLQLLLSGGLAIVILSIARISGFEGRTLIVDFIHIISAIGISGWTILHILKTWFPITIPGIELEYLNYYILVGFSGIVTIWIIELLIWIDITKRLPRILKIRPTLPWIYIFSRLEEVNHYVHRVPLIEHVTNVIKRFKEQNINKLDILWMTGTLDENIQKSFIDFCGPKKNNINIRILCPKDKFTPLPSLNEIIKKNQASTIKHRDSNPGFFRAIIINNHIIVGLTTGDSFEARTGFDPPTPVNWIVKEFLEYVWQNGYKK
jgi:hypothetical protein